VSLVRARKSRSPCSGVRREECVLGDQAQAQVSATTMLSEARAPERVVRDLAVLGRIGVLIEHRSGATFMVVSTGAKRSASRRPAQ